MSDARTHAHIYREYNGIESLSIGWNQQIDPIRFSLIKFDCYVNTIQSFVLIRNQKCCNGTKIKIKIKCWTNERTDGVVF